MKERIIVLVRTMPEESRKYGHRVCVAGINDNGEWRRLYPFKFDYGKKEIDFKKKDIIEVELIKAPNDRRVESRKVTNHKNIHSPLDDRHILNKIKPLVSSIKGLKEQKASLGAVKPEIIDFEIKVYHNQIYDEQKYLSLWTEEFLETREKVKLPVEARYIFKCGHSSCSCFKKPHKIKIIDWELNELARNLMKKYQDKKLIQEKIKEKFFDWMKKREVYFFLGTHFKFKTWLIIGVFYPDKVLSVQKTLLE